MTTYTHGFTHAIFIEVYVLSTEKDTSQQGYRFPVESERDYPFLCSTTFKALLPLVSKKLSSQPAD